MRQRFHSSQETVVRQKGHRTKETPSHMASAMSVQIASQRWNMGGAPTDDAVKPVLKGYHRGLRVTSGCHEVTSGITSQEARVQLNSAPLEDLAMRRRLGLFHRIVQSGSD